MMAGMHPVVPSTTMTVNLTKTIPVFSLSNDMIQSHGGHLGRGHSTLAMGPRLTGPRSGRNLSNLLVQPHWLHRWGQRGLTKLSHWTKTIELITGRGARGVLSPVGCWAQIWESPGPLTCSWARFPWNLPVWLQVLIFENLWQEH